ncbi:MAG: 4Fe-4S binding protein [DPANN group archaeon]|nr:4Fe-4S binding protein [DPANN group archaeon]
MAEDEKVNIAGIVTDVGNTKMKKTGSWRTEIPTVNMDICTGCGICKQFCPDGCIVIENKKCIIDYDYCKGCLICENVCPFKSITSKREDK